MRKTVFAVLIDFALASFLHGCAASEESNSITSVEILDDGLVGGTDPRATHNVETRGAVGRHDIKRKRKSSASDHVSSNVAYSKTDPEENAVRGGPVPPATNPSSLRALPPSGLSPEHVAIAKIQAVARGLIARKAAGKLREAASSRPRCCLGRPHISSLPTLRASSPARRPSARADFDVDYIASQVQRDTGDVISEGTVKNAISGDHQEYWKQKDRWDELVAIIQPDKFPDNGAITTAFFVFPHQFSQYTPQVVAQSVGVVDECVSMWITLG
jgi:hypothetical protein